MNLIHIHKPYVTSSGEGLYRLCADIDVAGTVSTVFVEVEEEYKNYFLVERSDAFVFLTLPIAIREGYNIECEVPVTEQFLHNIQQILLPTFLNADPSYKPISILAASASEPIETLGGVGTAVTCGVDSTYSIMQYTKEQYKDIKLSHLTVASVSKDLWDFDDSDNLYTWVQKHPRKFARYNVVSEYTGLPIVKIFTNFVPFITQRTEKNPSYKHLWNHTYITMSTMLALKKLFKVYIFSSAYDLSYYNVKNMISLDPSEYELLIMHVLSHREFMCFSGGASTDRIGKTLALTDYPLARKMLHPCFKDGIKNCSLPTCSKCMRGLFTLDYYNKLDEMSEVFDVDRYRKNRSKYLVSLVRLKENKSFQKLHAMFKDKYPEDMQKAELEYENSIEPVSREKYNDLVRAYDTLLLLLTDEIPRNNVKKFFAEKNIKRLYYVSNSRFGKKILDLLDGEIEVITYKTGDVNTCDAIFIACTNDKAIIKSKTQVKKKLNRDMDMYSIVDIKKALSEDK